MFKLPRLPIKWPVIQMACILCLAIYVYFTISNLDKIYNTLMNERIDGLREELLNSIRSRMMNIPLTTVPLPKVPLPRVPITKVKIANDGVHGYHHGDDYELVMEEDADMYEMNILTTITSIPHDVDMIINVHDDHQPVNNTTMGVIIEVDDEEDSTENVKSTENVETTETTDNTISEEPDHPTETAPVTVVAASCEITPALPSVKQLKSMRMDELRAILTECDASFSQTGLKKDALIAAIAPYTTSS